jgi:transcriptional antiterminator Rof (Rho-off)
MNKEYKPIACGLHDELELRALRKNKVELSFRGESNSVQTINCVIADIFSKDKVEYLKTDKGLLIRLDDILELDGIRFNQSC